MARSVPKHVIEALRAMPLFAGSSNGELQAVARLGTTITVDDGYVFTRQGRRGYEFFVLLEGEATCVLDDKELARFHPGEFFGEMALVDAEPRSATVTAIDRATVLVIDSREFNSLFDLAPAATRRVLAAMSERLRAAQAV
jgi:CRP-like cAMP-binding protein